MQQNRTLRVCLFLTFLAFSTLPACAQYGHIGEAGPQLAPPEASTSPTDPPAQAPDNNFSWEHIEAPQLADEVVIPEDEPCIDEVTHSIASGSDELHFTFLCGPESFQLKPGDIVVGTEGGGYLREILEIERDQWTATAVTEQAQLADVLLNGGFREQLSFDDSARNNIDFSGKELFSGNVGDADLSLSLSKGSISIDPTLTLAADFGWFSLQNADAILEVDMDAELEVVAAISNELSLEDSVQLGQVNYPFAFAAGPVPVAGVLQVRLHAGFEISAEAEAEASIGMDTQSSVTVGMEYREGDWTPISKKDWDTSLIGPDFNLSAELGAKVYIEVEARVMLYGTVGPSFGAAPYLRAQAEAECYDLDWSAHAGVDLSAAIHLDVFVFELEKSWGPWSFEGELGSGHYQLDSALGTDCDEPSPECAPGAALSCGDLVFGNTATDDTATNELDGYTFSVGNYEAAEVAYSFVTEQAGPVEIGFRNQQPTFINHDIFILDGSSNQCLPSETVEWGLNRVTFEPSPGKTYFVVVDGYDGDEGAFELAVDCGA